MKADSIWPVITAMFMHGWTATKLLNRRLCMTQNNI